MATNTHTGTTNPWNGVPTDEVTWEVSLSSREAIARPANVPMLSFESIVPSVENSRVSLYPESDSDQVGVLRFRV